MKTVHAGGLGEGVKKRQNSVHVVVECPLTSSGLDIDFFDMDILYLYELLTPMV
jgi:hypothetical protein